MNPLAQLLLAEGPVPGGGNGFPGQSGNPVGHTAAPGFTSLTAYPGGGGTINVTDGTHATSGSGTVGDPWIFQFYDFNAGTSGTVINLQNAIFKGCRFQSNSTVASNVAYVSSASNVLFSYCTVQPLVSQVGTAPPNAAWPSASARTGINLGSPTFLNYSVSAVHAYQFGISIFAGSGPITVDHCDIWGFGNAITCSNNTSTVVHIKDCWIHDACIDPAAGYHTDGPGYLGGSGTCSNVTVQHCTIASLGNTNSLAFQAATSYSNMLFINNYLTCFGAIAIGGRAPTVSGCQFTDNFIATDVCWANNTSSMDSGSTIYTTANGNLWRRNTLLCVSPITVNPTNPTVWGGVSITMADSGKFIYPDNSLNVTDFTG